MQAIFRHRQHQPKFLANGDIVDEFYAMVHTPIAMKDAIWPMPNTSRWKELQAILSKCYEEEISEGSEAFVPTLSNVVQSLIPGIREGKATLISSLRKSPRMLAEVRKFYRFTKRNLTSE